MFGLVGCKTMGYCMGHYMQHPDAYTVEVAVAVAERHWAGPNYTGKCKKGWCSSYLTLRVFQSLIMESTLKRMERIDIYAKTYEEFI